MAVPISTRTGEWIDATVAALKVSRRNLETLATKLERAASDSDLYSPSVLYRAAAQLREEAKRLQTAELPF